MKKLLHYGWLMVFFGLLLYGGVTYLQTVSIEKAFQQVKSKEVIYTPVQISKATESQLTQRLGEQRHPALRGLSWLKATGLQTSFIHKVVIGQDDYLFLGSEIPTRPVDQQSVGQYAYSPEDLTRTQLILQQRQHWCQTMGIAYILVIAPNKASVYPEYLPKRYNYHTQTSTDQLLEHLPPAISVIDLRDCLKKEKHRENLYLPTDTHWNEVGAYYGYKCVLQALPESFTAIPIVDTIRRDTHRLGGDISRMLLMEDRYAAQRPLVFPLQDLAQFDSLRSKADYGPQPYIFTNPDGLPKRVFFAHDSFFRPLRKFFPQHYAETIFYWDWQGFPRPLIEQIQPDLVIDEWVERALIGDRPRNDWSILQTWWQSHFSTLPDKGFIKKMPLDEVIGYIATHSDEPHNISVTKLTFPNLPPGEKIILTYDDDKGFHHLPTDNPTVYIESERDRLRKIVLEKSPSNIEVEVQLRWMTTE